MKILLLDSGLGLIPFINEIIKNDKKNSYFLFMDYENFPYGKKKISFLVKRLEYLLKQFEVLGIDKLLICCNTMSKIYERVKYKPKYKVKTILSLNLCHLGNSYLLVTPTLKKLFKSNNQVISCNLASSIEKYDYVKIINEIKSFNFNKSVILGCTHFPLVKSIFNHYSSFKTRSYENEFISKIENGNVMKFYGRDYEINIFKKYFPDIRILTYYLS